MQSCQQSREDQFFQRVFRVVGRTCPKVMAQRLLSAHLPRHHGLRIGDRIPRNGGTVLDFDCRRSALRSQNGVARSCAEVAATCPTGEQIRGRTVGAQERAKHPQCAAELAVSVGLFRRTVTSLKKPVVRVAVSRTKFQQISQPQGIAVTCTGSLLGALTAHLSNAPPLNCIGMRGGREPSPFCSTNRSQCSFLKDTLSLTRYTSNFPSLI